MHQTDDKPSLELPDDTTAGRLSAPWARLFEAPSATAAGVRSQLGFFVEVVAEADQPWAWLDVAPVLLTAVFGEPGRFQRPVPLDSKQLAQAPLPADELQLAASVLGLPQMPRKTRVYVRLQVFGRTAAGSGAGSSLLSGRACRAATGGRSHPAAELAVASGTGWQPEVVACAAA